MNIKRFVSLKVCIFDLRENIKHKNLRHTFKVVNLLIFFTLISTLTVPFPRTERQRDLSCSQEFPEGKILIIAIFFIKKTLSGRKFKLI